MQVLAGLEVLVGRLIVVGFLPFGGGDCGGGGVLFFGFVPAAQVVAEVLVLEVFVISVVTRSHGEFIYGVAVVGEVCGGVDVGSVGDVSVGGGWGMGVRGGGFGIKVPIHEVLLLTVVVQSVVGVVTGTFATALEDLTAVDLLFQVDQGVVHIDDGIGCVVETIV